MRDGRYPWCRWCLWCVPVARRNHRDATLRWPGQPRCHIAVVSGDAAGRPGRGRRDGCTGRGRRGQASTASAGTGPRRGGRRAGRGRPGQADAPAPADAPAGAPAGPAPSTLPGPAHSKGAAPMLHRSGSGGCRGTPAAGDGSGGRGRRVNVTGRGMADAVTATRASSPAPLPGLAPLEPHPCSIDPAPAAPRGAGCRRRARRPGRTGQMRRPGQAVGGRGKQGGYEGLVLTSG